MASLGYDELSWNATAQVVIFFIMKHRWATYVLKKKQLNKYWNIDD